MGNVISKLRFGSLAIVAISLVLTGLSAARPAAGEDLSAPEISTAPAVAKKKAKPARKKAKRPQTDEVIRLSNDDIPIERRFYHGPAVTPPVMQTAPNTIPDPVSQPPQAGQAATTPPPTAVPPAAVPPPAAPTPTSVPPAAVPSDGPYSAHPPTASPGTPAQGTPPPPPASPPRR
jgi:hypothetical protein